MNPNPKKFPASFPLLAVAILLLCGCSGGGGSSTPSAASTSSTTLSGVAMAGAINGTVCVYPLSEAGAAGSTSLGCNTTTPATGAYSINLGTYSGGVIVKAYGNYIDEATGLIKVISQLNSLRSTASCTGSSCQAAVTPLTEVAVQTAGELTSAKLSAAYQKVAQAFGLNPASENDAYARLVTLLPTTSGSDSAAASYAGILAVLSQAQSKYCGQDATCNLENYLEGVQTEFASANGIAALQAAMKDATLDWNGNSRNTFGLSCSFATTALTCKLPGSSSGSSGNYKMTISVTAQGVTSAGVTIEKVSKPATENEFCNSSEIKSQLNGSLSKKGTITLNSCSFSGNTGTIDATVTINSPMPTSIPYMVSYVYSTM